MLTATAGVLGGAVAEGKDVERKGVSEAEEKGIAAVEEAHGDKEIRK